MTKCKDLKMFLESSLNEIFKATVNDILDSVDRTLSEYQGKIQRIESENEDLRRMLFTKNNTECSPAGEQDVVGSSSASNRNACTMTTPQDTFRMSIRSSDKKSSRRKHKDKMRESKGSNHYPLQSGEITVEPGNNVPDATSIKTEPGLEHSGAIDLSKPPSPVNLTVRSIKPDSPDVTDGSHDIIHGSHDAYTSLLTSSDPNQDSSGRESESMVHTTSPGE